MMSRGQCDRLLHRKAVVVLALLQCNSGCFIWSLPHSLTAGTCSIDIRGEDGNEGDNMFTQSKEIQIVDTHQITFIQTDKPVYKPRDTVKFRLLTVTQDLKPLKADIDSVTIHDPHDFYMRQWLAVQPQAGLVSLDYRLYDEPVLGDWKIVAVVNGRKIEQSFSVQQYVLPKFQVYMELPKSLTVATKSLQFEVCARYTFGKPVTGSVSASVCLENTETSWFCENRLRPCAYIQSKMNGCHNFTVETKDLKVTERQFSLLCKPRLMVHANVTEKDTGLTVEEKQQGVGVWEERVKLKFISDKYFKPFFPYTGKLYAWKPDGSPAAGEKVTLTIGKLGILATLYIDKTGHAEFSIQNLTHSTPYFILHAKTDDSDYTDKKYYTIFPATTKKHVKQWYSPTSSYVRLSTEHQGQRTCGETITIDVVHSITSDITIQSVTAQIMSKGNIIEHTDVTEEMSRSSPYLPFLKGQVLTPRLNARSPRRNDDRGDEDHSLQPGPLSDLGNFEAGPPGSGSQAAGPPGSSTGTKHPARQENLDLDEAMAPGPIPQDLTAIAVEGDPLSVTLTWQPPQEPDGEITGYLVFYTTDLTKDDFDWVVEGVIGDRLSVEINDLTADTVYYFRVQARTRSGYGPKSPTTIYITPKSSGKDSIYSDMTPPNLRHFSLRQYISRDMAPKMRLLVYMITNTREMVADTLDIDVGHCYNNQVNMTFKQRTVRPGDTVDLTLKASPGSLCSAGMVDKSE
ncbi:pregnancy zone protein-like isoform X2 [Mercenaria mercenaria]|uniref:pregnancy zone protein-like isoform X2 n=1 Tax=Mercenaria mercenaria TaxID=6596 RepID=UPI00234EBC55|nr:pregnancy zone protein-like isoform X2 [Mercenaria mercenaria]